MGEYENGSDAAGDPQSENERAGSDKVVTEAEMQKALTGAMERVKRDAVGEAESAAARRGFDDRVNARVAQALAAHPKLRDDARKRDMLQEHIINGLPRDEKVVQAMQGRNDTALGAAIDDVTRRELELEYPKDKVAEKEAADEAALKASLEAKAEAGPTSGSEGGVAPGQGSTQGSEGRPVRWAERPDRERFGLGVKQPDENELMRQHDEAIEEKLLKPFGLKATA